MKVALVYDRVNKWGGAERVLLALHELFPNASLYTSVYNSQAAPWAHVFTINTSFLQYIPFASSSHEYFAPFMGIAFEQFSFDEYDLVISITSEAAKGIITTPKTLHICYCLTPTRYLWSGYNEYFNSPLLKTVTKPIVYSMRQWDKVASSRPDVYVAISKEVKRRIKDYYNRDSIVIYPPVEVPNFPAKQDLAQRDKGQISNTKYYLVVSRLVPYKRIDLAIRACNLLNVALKIVGVGSDEMRLRSIAGRTVEFLGSLTDQQLKRYYKESQALLFPGTEDFGLVIVESLLNGKPVVAFNGGGARETVLNKKTGILFEPQTANGLVRAIKRFEPREFNQKDCISQGRKFAKERFKKEFLKVIRKTINHI